MPVTAKLSKAVYDRLGDEVVNQFVDWFNQVDAAYRADLKQFNELNFSRFEGKLDAVEVKLDARLDAKLGALEAKLSAKIDSLETHIGAAQSSIIAHLEKRLNDQTRFFFLAWAALLASNFALWFR